MNKTNTHNCLDCDETISGAAKYCLSCYKKHLVVCGECCRLNWKGTVVYIRRNGKLLIRGCKHCNGQGWLFTHET